MYDINWKFSSLTFLARCVSCRRPEEGGHGSGRHDHDRGARSHAGLLGAVRRLVPRRASPSEYTMSSSLSVYQNQSDQSLTAT